MASSNLRTFMIALIVSAMMFIGLSNFLFGLGTSYGVTLDENLTGAYNTINNTLLPDVASTSEDMQNKLSNDEVSADGGEAGILISMFEVVKLPFSLIYTITTVITTVSVNLGIPGWFTTGIIAILFILVSTIVLSIVFRKDL